MRSIWTGAISFGLIYIPIKLYDATRAHRVNFDMIRKKDHCRVGYVRVCKETGEEVPYQDIVKGYEYRKGEYVVIEPDDFKKANVKKSQTIEMVGFTNADQIDQKFLEKPYFLEPVREAKKAYALLREAMKKSGKVGIARYVLKTREHMALIKPDQDVLILNQMRFADEIRPSSELNVPGPGTESVSEKELDMAIKLIDQLTEPWKPEKYHDTYYEDLKKIIQDKVEGKIPQPVKEEPVPSGVTDLFSSLAQSLEMAQKGNKAA
ncbi:Ku protein [Chitinispirillales bacterium ANBcel5]|uniref:non-homologous end joining protein Ku n=1 Tax=Cellulosispirillum alkaliphilum TaxID=3039283 RepID=UPI002A52598E|nr:Ku protein [Chitinispirillales bacterium ANBcel5]